MYLRLGLNSTNLVTSTPQRLIGILLFWFFDLNKLRFYVEPFFSYIYTYFFSSLICCCCCWFSTINTASKRQRMLISLFMCLKFRISYSLTYLRIVAYCFVCFGTFIVCCTLFTYLPLFVLSSRAHSFLFHIYRADFFSFLSLSFSLCLCLSSSRYFFIFFFLILHCRWSQWCLWTRWKYTHIHTFNYYANNTWAMILLFSLTLFFGCALLMINIFVWNSFKRNLKWMLVNWAKLMVLCWLNDVMTKQILIVFYS